MSFFKDFKADFTQAMNELMPDNDEMVSEYDDEDIVNTFDEEEKVEDKEPDIDDMDIAPEDLMDDFEDDDIDAIIEREEAKRAASVNEYSNEDIVDTFDSVNDEVVNDNADTIDQLLDDLLLANEPNNEEDIQQVVESNEFIDKDIVSEEFDDVEVDTFDDLIPQESVEETAEKIVTEDMPETVVEEILEDIPEDIPTNEEVMPEEFIEDILKEMPEEVDTLEEELTEEMPEEVDTFEEEIVEDIPGEIEPMAEMFEEVIETEDNVEDYSDVPVEEVKENVMEEKEIINIVDVKEEKTEVDATPVAEPVEVDAATTYITKGTKIKGNVETDSSIDVIGTVEGDISCKGKLVIGGTVIGKVKAGEIYANAAKMEGDIETDGSVKVGVGTVIVGNVIAKSAVIAGAVNGDIDVQGPVIVDSTAVIMGNIKSRSVQINNGAVLEGMCSQSYSDIDVKSFFA